MFSKCEVCVDSSKTDVFDCHQNSENFEVGMQANCSRWQFAAQQLSEKLLVLKNRSS